MSGHRIPLKVHTGNTHTRRCTSNTIVIQTMHSDKVAALAGKPRLSESDFAHLNQ